ATEAADHPLGHALLHTARILKVSNRVFEAPDTVFQRFHGPVGSGGHRLRGTGSRLVGGSAALNDPKTPTALICFQHVAHVDTPPDRLAFPPAERFQGRKRKRKMEFTYSR